MGEKCVEESECQCEHDGQVMEVSHLVGVVGVVSIVVGVVGFACVVVGSRECTHCSFSMSISIGKTTFLSLKRICKLPWSTGYIISLHSDRI